ncbi:hypothetical protein DFH08DRAFT_1080942 [Mycena albidolilacea]|uniref:Glucose-methanol-choline oxidoreductase N-terminal domain-containing protein n=1 Tax=Mycena albidolilacea TaxID=1033008 RepID=A0AAD7EQI3_9AGAR|nr:hypothetical protein DFH08DRAFT_1080942 [Mycena albidolilacea]
MSWSHAFCRVAMILKRASPVSPLSERSNIPRALEIRSIPLHSGIGDSESLASLGISPVHDLPSVGRNLSDHPHVRISWLVNSTKTFDNAERHATIASEELEEWLTTKTGPLIDSIISQIGWLRLPDN